MESFKIVTQDNKIKIVCEKNNKKFYSPIELITTLINSSFKDPYHIRYNKQLLHILLRGND